MLSSEDRNITKWKVFAGLRANNVNSMMFLHTAAYEVQLDCMWLLAVWNTKKWLTLELIKPDVGHKCVWVVHCREKCCIYDSAVLLQVIFSCGCISNQSQLLYSVYSPQSAKCIYSQAACQVHLEDQYIFFHKWKGWVFPPILRVAGHFSHQWFCSHTNYMKQIICSLYRQQKILKILNV